MGTSASLPLVDRNLRKLVYAISKQINFTDVRCQVEETELPTIMRSPTAQIALPSQDTLKIQLYEDGDV